MGNVPKEISKGTDTFDERKRKISSHMAQVTPLTKKGEKDVINVVTIIDWNGELFTVNMKGNVNIQQALTATYWSQLSANVCAIFRKGLPRL